jgi:hypothetical protein
MESNRILRNGIPAPFPRTTALARIVSKSEQKRLGCVVTILLLAQNLTAEGARDALSGEVPSQT